MAECLFCGIVDRTVPATIVHEDEDVLAFEDIDPAAPFHVLVIPKRHVATLAAAGPGVAGAAISTAVKLAIDAGHAEKGYRVVVNTGPSAGQSVAHLHVHVLAGRALGWPPG